MPRKADPGYIIFLDDQKKLGAIKVIGRRSIPVTPYRIKAWFKTEQLARDLQKLYNEMAGFRITGDWFVEDAVDMYLDSRRGVA